MQRYRWIVAGAAALALAAGLLAGQAPARAQQKTVVWNLPTVAAPTYFHTVNYTAFAAKVKEKSAGRMEIRIHPASSLYPSFELLPALLDGRSEYGTDSANVARILGAAPVNMAFGEVYSALEKKTVDGAMTSATNAEPMKFYEVAKYLDYWFLAGAAMEWLVVNQKAWDALPTDL